MKKGCEIQQFLRGSTVHYGLSLELSSANKLMMGLG